MSATLQKMHYMYKETHHIPSELSQIALEKRRLTIELMLEAIISGKYNLRPKLEAGLIQNIIEISKFGPKKLPSYYEQEFFALVNDAIKKLEKDMPEKIDLINALKEFLNSSPSSP